VTPPGWWHSHHNETGEPALVLPVQDAGLYTYQRTLDIRYNMKDSKLVHLTIHFSVIIIILYCRFSRE